MTRGVQREQGWRRLTSIEGLTCVRHKREDIAVLLLEGDVAILFRTHGDTNKRALPVQSAHCRGARPDVVPNQLNREFTVQAPNTVLRGRYYVPTPRRRLAVSCHRPRSILAGGGRMGNGQP